MNSPDQPIDKLSVINLLMNYPDKPIDKPPVLNRLMNQPWSMYW